MKGFTFKFSKHSHYYRDAAGFVQTGLCVTEADGVVHFTPLRSDGNRPTISITIPVADLDVFIAQLVNSSIKHR